MKACKSKFTLLFTALLFLSWQTIFAQGPIKGKVTDSNNAGLAGVSIQIKGTSKGATSDATGSFTINASKGNTLVFSSVGFAKKEVVVSDASTLNVVLDSDVQSLEEVVVTALGVSKEARKSRLCSHKS